MLSEHASSHHQVICRLASQFGANEPQQRRARIDSARISRHVVPKDARKIRRTPDRRPSTARFTLRWHAIHQLFYASCARCSGGSLCHK